MRGRYTTLRIFAAAALAAAAALLPGCGDFSKTPGHAGIKFKNPYAGSLDVGWTTWADDVPPGATPRDPEPPLTPKPAKTPTATTAPAIADKN